METIKIISGNTLAKKILFIRKKAKIDQKQLAKILGMTAGRLSKYEKGLGRPSNDIMRKLMDIGKDFGVEFDIYDMLSAHGFSKIKRKMKLDKIEGKKNFSDILHKQTLGLAK